MSRDWNIKWSALDIQKDEVRAHQKARMDDTRKRMVIKGHMEHLNETLEYGGIARDMIRAMNDDDKDGLFLLVIKLVSHISGQLKELVGVGESIQKELGRDYDLKLALRDATQTHESMDEFILMNLPIDMLAQLANDETGLKVVEKKCPARLEEVKAYLANPEPEPEPAPKPKRSRKKSGGATT